MLSDMDQNCSSVSEIRELLSQLSVQADFSGRMACFDGEVLKSYNDIVSKLRITRPHHSQIDIDALPDDVLIAIFEQFTAPSSLDEKWAHESLFPLLSVCTRWEKMILGTPSLWSVIVVSEQREDVLATLETSLVLSKNYSLTLLYDFGCRDVQSFALLLAPHQHRITSLQVSWPDTRLTVDKYLQKAVFPSLQVFEIGSRTFGYLFSKQIDVDDCIQRYFGSTAVGEVSQACKKAIYNVSLAGGRMDKLGIRPGTGNFLVEVLQEVGAQEQLSDVEIIDEVSDEAARLDFDNLGESPLQWGVFRISSNSWAIVTDLASRAAFSLRHLDVRMPVVSLYFFYEILSDLSMLNHLSVTIAIMDQELDMPPYDFSAPAQLLRVQTLRIALDKSRLTGGGAIGLVGGGAIEDNVSALSCHLLQSTPNLVVLSLEIHLGATWEKLIDEISHLKSLLITTIADVYSGVRFASTMKKIQKLTLRGDPDVVSSFRSESVELLEVHGTSKWPPKTSFRHIHWPSLRILTLRSEHLEIISTRIKLPALLELCLQGYAITSAVIFKLANNPSDLPKLQRLSLRGSDVDWDMLFIMLEKRIFAQIEDVDLLQTLDIRGRISPQLQCHLVNLQRGNLLERPSNMELSANHIYPILLDGTIPGCLSCHYRLVECKEPLSWSSTWRPALTPYPDTLESIFSSHESRMKELFRLRNAASGLRKESCPAELEVITISHYTVLPPTDQFDTLWY